MDGEKLIVRILGSNNQELGRREHSEIGSATQQITVEECGTIMFEVTVDAGTNAADVASLFEIGVGKAECK